MTEEQKLVLKWYHCGKNYNEGVGLFSQISPNKQMSRVFPGREYRYRDKLEYELCKAVNLDWKNMPENPEPETDLTDPDTGDSAVNKIIDASDKSAEHITEFTRKIADAVSDNESAAQPPEAQPSKTYPEEIEKILKEHSRLQGVRSGYHGQMGEVPEDNTPESISRRKELSDLMANCSAQIEKLYAAKEAYFTTGTMPDMEVLFPAEAAKKELKLPDDPESLAKMKKNLQTSICKDQNQLEYQSDSKKDAPDPMPEGAQRIKLVKRIQAKQETIGEINLKLARGAD